VKWILERVFLQPLLRVKVSQALRHCLGSEQDLLYVLYWCQLPSSRLCVSEMPVDTAAECHFIFLDPRMFLSLVRVSVVPFTGPKRCCTVGRAGVRHYSRIDKNCGPQDVHVGLITPEVISKRQCTQRVFSVTMRHTIQVALRSYCVASPSLQEHVSLASGGHTNIFMPFVGQSKTHNVGAVSLRMTLWSSEA
jgi:hypothetical protein